jgi:hypothetical protein
VAEGGGLENHCARKGTGGSNPSSSVESSVYRGFILVGFGLTGDCIGFVATLSYSAIISAAFTFSKTLHRIRLCPF